MSSTLALSITLGDALAIGVAVVAIIVGAVAARRWGSRRRRLAFAFQSTPLLPETSADRSLLKVTFREIEVADPHLLTLRLRNVGPSDVASEHFDAEKPLTIELNCTMYGLTHTSHPGSTTSSALGSEGTVALRPQLLRRKEEWTVEAVVGGVAAPTFSSSLIDTDIVEGITERGDIARGLLEVMFELWGGRLVRLP